MVLCSSRNDVYFFGSRHPFRQTRLRPLSNKRPSRTSTSGVSGFGHVRSRRRLRSARELGKFCDGGRDEQGGSVGCAFRL